MEGEEAEEEEDLFVFNDTLESACGYKQSQKSADSCEVFNTSV